MQTYELFNVVTGQVESVTVDELEETIVVEPVVVTGEMVRIDRDRRLTASDWTQVSDAPVDKAAWAAYRQALRDVPQQAGFPETVIWPEKPA